MSSTNFVSGTVITSPWLNDVDSSTYQGQLDDGTPNAAIDQYLPAGTGAVATTVQTKLRESVSVYDFMTAAQIADVQSGALTLDVTAALNAAADSVRGGFTADTVLLIPKGLYRCNSALDFTRVRHILCLGEIRSAVTSGAAVTIGTASNANTDMDNGDINLTVRSTAANNSGLSGVSGILVKGAARCNFRLYSYGWDIGVYIAPDAASSTQYVAFCNFQIYTNGNRTGIKITALNGSFVNQNAFYRCDCYPQGNALAGSTIGCHMTGTIANNNNEFLHCNFEGMTVPIWVETGLQNQFFSTRLELSGPVRFGNSSASGDQPLCVDNFVHALYQNSKYGVQVDWQASRPNFVSYIDPSPIWVPEVSINYDDFYAVGATGYSHKMLNVYGDTGYFPNLTLDSSDRSFSFGAASQGYVWIKVQAGDILRLFTSGPTLDYIFAIIEAYGSGKAALPALAASDTPYFGTNATPNAAGASGTGSTVVFSNNTWNKPSMVSVNRAAVQWLKVSLLTSTKYNTLYVDRLLNSQNINDFRVNQFTPYVGVANFTGQSSFAGQIGVAGANRVAVGNTANGWIQIGQVPVSDTAANIASAAATINTTNKVAGLVVRDTTNNRLMFSTGSTATSVWWVVDGSASVTPV